MKTRMPLALLGCSFFFELLNLELFNLFASREG